VDIKESPAFKAINAYFLSGNGTPVERASIKFAEWQDLVEEMSKKRNTFEKIDTLVADLQALIASPAVQELKQNTPLVQRVMSGVMVYPMASIGTTVRTIPIEDIPIAAIRSLVINLRASISDGSRSRLDVCTLFVNDDTWQWIIEGYKPYYKHNYKRSHVIETCEKLLGESLA
jgi:hypothetical protein